MTTTPTTTPTAGHDPTDTNHRRRRLAHRLAGRFGSDRGAISANGIAYIAAIALLLAWSQGMLAPVSGIIPGTSSYENQPGNDAINGFRNGYNESRCRIDWVEEDPTDCPWGQGDNYIEPENRSGLAGAEVAAP